MCTVTLSPLQNNSFILTSNRDEAINRKTLLPDFYKVNQTRMLFPKDAVAGGTWIGLSDNNTMVCLLNGGFERHKRKALYNKSRGVVVKDLLEAKNIKKAIEAYCLSGVEPFTIVAADWQTELAFYELVWDGRKKYFKALDNRTYIWSSSTLYTSDMKIKREGWFRGFEQNNVLTPDTLLDFHKNAGIGDKNIDLRIDRGMLKTRSITQIVKNEEEVSMRYENLQDQEVHTVVFEALTV